MTPKTLFSATILIAAGTIAGRLLGLLREMLLAAQLGASHQANIAIALLVIPDFVSAALIGSAVSAALVPAFTKRDQQQSMALFWQAMLVSTGAFAAIALALSLDKDALIQMLDPDHAFAGQSYVFWIMLLTIPVNAALAVVTAYLQYRGRFMVPAFATVLLNGCIILALWLAPGSLAGIACGILIGCLLRLLAHMVAFYRSGGRWLSGHFKSWELRAPLFKAYGITVSSCLLLALVQYIPYAVVAAAGSNVAIFNYAFKLVLLPCLLGQAVVQMVLLPWFSHLSTTDGVEKRNANVSMVLQLVWILAINVCLAMAMANKSLAALCFGYGKMTQTDIAMVGSLFAVGLWALPGMLLASVWQQVLYANEKVNSALWAGLVQVILIVTLCLAGRPWLGMASSMAAFALVQVPYIVMLAWHGYRLGMIVHWYPSRLYARMTGASLGVFIPLAMVFNALSLPAWGGVACACVAGLLTLAAGIAASRPLRAVLLPFGPFGYFR